MDLLLKCALILHIAAGFTALLSGLIAIIATKGGKQHKLAGKYFYWAMIMVAVTAVFIAVFKALTFLFSIAVFSFYLTYSGYRSVKEKTGHTNLTDKAVMLLMILVSIYMLSTGKIVLMVFGIISLINVVSDIRFSRIADPSKNAWLYRHIAKMSGAYIATVTAFLVTNINFLPGILVWLLPTIIGSPLIAYTIRKYKLKLSV